MAQCVLNDMVQKKNLGDEFVIESSATSTEEIGNPIHRGTVNKLNEVGVKVLEHRAIQLKKSDLEKYDYFIAMDSANVRMQVLIEILLIHGIRVILTRLTRM